MVREEMDAMGRRRILAPVPFTVRLWEATSQGQDLEIFRVTDRAGRRFLLPMTHEETVTFHARELQWLQGAAADAATASRQGPRRAAAARRADPLREFIMKDAYSFDRDEKGRRTNRSRHTAPPTSDLGAMRRSKAHEVKAECARDDGR